MFFKKYFGNSEFGSRLSDSILITEENLNILFTALMLTALGVFLVGNLLMLDYLVLQGTLPIAFACFSILIIFYALSRALKNLSWGLVITYGLMCLISYSRFPWLVPISFIGAVFGLFYVLKTLRIGLKELGFASLMGLIGTAVILGSGKTYTSFDMLQRLGAGDVHVDTLFHASIAAMIKNYGVISTGLNGLVETPYHVLSHELIASVSRLSGAGILEVYGVAPHILFAPILIFSVVACCVMLDTTKVLNIPLAWGCVCILFALAPLLFSKWAFWNSYFVSESYLVSLGLFLFALPSLYKRDLMWSDILLVAILAFLISNAKASVGLIYFGLWLLRLVFLRSSKWRIELSAVALIGLIVALTVFQSASVNAPTEIVFLEFVGAYSFQGQNLVEVKNYFLGDGTVSWRSVVWALVAVVTFFIIHFLFSWIVVARLVCAEGWHSLIKAPATIYSLGAVAAGIVIVMFFKVPGGSAYYFSNIAFFVSLPLVVLWGLNDLGYLVNKLKVNEAISTSAMLIFGIFFAILMGWKDFKHTFASHQKIASQHNEFVDQLVSLRTQMPINGYIRLNPMALSNNPIKECRSQPFVYPAVSERPWINVIVPKIDCLYQYFGYEQYGLTPQQQNVTVPINRREMIELSWPSSADILSKRE